MAYASWSVTALEVPNATKWNILGTNDSSFNDGTGIANDAIKATHLDWAATGANGGIWWEELGRVSASSGTTMEITSIPARKYLRIIYIDTGSSANGSDMQFNADTGNNYASARSLAGVAFSVQASISGMEVMGNYKGMQQAITELVNLANMEKVAQTQWTTGPQGGTQNSAAQVPAYAIYANKWANASVQITRVKVTRRGGAFASGSELIVLGHN